MSTVIGQVSIYEYFPHGIYPNKKDFEVAMKGMTTMENTRN